MRDQSFLIGLMKTFNNNKKNKKLLTELKPTQLERNKLLHDKIYALIGLNIKKVDDTV